MLNFIKKYNYLVAMLIMLVVSGVFAMIYKFLTVIEPNSFYGLSPANHLIDFWYYSLTTMTTVGYGDVYPLTQAARFITITQVVTGVAIFLGIVISTVLITREKRKSRDTGR
ncbi:potassium channel family protein [Desulforamulus putei]|uniref:potassium channel family protein n=1 Tax=Desulforamulus putei TaxID=74701 RepID=UPI002FDEC011